MTLDPIQSYNQGKADREQEILNACGSPISKRQIIEQEVCVYFGLTYFNSKSRKPAVLYPRNVLIYILDHNGFDHDQIKSILGIQNQYTIKSAVAKLESQRKIYGHIKRDIDYIQTKVISRICFFSNS